MRGISVCACMRCWRGRNAGLRHRACAAVVAGVRLGLLQAASQIRVSLPGGDLHIEWQPGDDVMMTGPVERCLKVSCNTDEQTKCVEFFSGKSGFWPNMPKPWACACVTTKCARLRRLSWRRRKSKPIKTAQMAQMMAAAEANHATMQRLLALDIALLRANTVAAAQARSTAAWSRISVCSNTGWCWRQRPAIAAKIPPALCVADERTKAEIAAMEAPMLGSKISPALRTLLPADGKVAESFCSAAGAHRRPNRGAVAGG